MWCLASFRLPRFDAYITILKATPAIGALDGARCFPADKVCMHACSTGTWLGVQ
jgi:hypothetical protein